MITKDFFYCNYQVSDKETLFKEMSKDLVAKGFVQDGFDKALLEREINFPTGLPVPHGVAIPHTDGTLVNADQLVFITLKQPIEFNEMGGDEEDVLPVRVIIMLAVKDGKKHLTILQNLIEAIQKEGFISGLLAAESTDGMGEIINKYIAETVA
ncbi:PTS sugar transporter subunit IIA [Enterococcus lactis]|uniref:PTS sugar transporter subunit IIA n=1 Tax=Enterococcus lactis TaxID=357441 RepID=UPI002412A528|nr:PTS sugar transporter subunit IIA [Enterococcus lactis]